MDPQINIAGTLHLDGNNLFTSNGGVAGSPTDLNTALARLAELPLIEIPPHADLPVGSHMPLPPNPLFVGRETELRSLAAQLKGGVGIAAIGQVTAATGLGGIGKTGLAATFVHHYGTYFMGGVYWLSMADPANVITEIARCGWGMTELPTNIRQLSLAEQAAAVQRAWQSPLPRLLVFDNCEDPALLARWRPTTGACRVLVTSRRTSWDLSLSVTVITLGVLPRTKSRELLAKFRPDLAGVPVLDEIAAELGDLPLALHLAGSYLKTTRHDLQPAVYLAQVRQPTLLNHISMQHGDVSPTAHELHVARTFALSYNQLQSTAHTDTLALRLLASAACFAPGETIPRALLRESLLHDPTTTATPLHWRMRLKQLFTGHKTTYNLNLDSSFVDAVNRLTALGLVEEGQEGSLVLHRLLVRFITDVAPVAVTAAQPLVDDLDQQLLISISTSVCFPLPRKRSSALKNNYPPALPLQSRVRLPEETMLALAATITAICNDWT